MRGVGVEVQQQMEGSGWLHVPASLLPGKQPPVPTVHAVDLTRRDRVRLVTVISQIRGRRPKTREDKKANLSLRFIMQTIKTYGKM
jgi:hypothetical protein